MNDITQKFPSPRLPSIAEQFPGAEGVTYLDTAARSLLPLTAKMAVEQHLDDRLLGRADKVSTFAAVEKARGRFANLIGLCADECGKPATVFHRGRFTPRHQKRHHQQRKKAAPRR